MLTLFACWPVLIVASGGSRKPSKRMRRRRPRVSNFFTWAGCEDILCFALDEWSGYVGIYIPFIYSLY